MMAGGIADFFVMIGSKFDAEGLNAAVTKMDEFEKKTQKVAEEFKKIGAAFMVVGAAITAVFVIAVKDAQNYAVELDKLSKTTGISTESLSKLGYAAKQEHASMEALAQGFKFLARNMYDAKDGTGEAAEAFKHLGITVVDSNGQLRNSENVLLDVAEKFKGMTNEGEKSALAMKIFGRSGVELVPFLNLGKEEIIRLGKEAERLGIVLSKDNVAAFKKFEDAQDAITAGFMGIKIAVANAVLPILQDLSEQVQKLIEWINSWSKETKLLIAIIIGITGAVATLSGGLLLLIAYLPKIITSTQILFTLLMAHPLVAIAVALAAVTLGITEYIYQAERAKNRDMEIVQSKEQVLKALIKSNAEIKEQIKNFKVTGDEAERLARQYNNQKVAIEKLTKEIKDGSITTKENNETRAKSLKLAIELNKQMGEDTSALQRFNEGIALAAISIEDFNEGIKKTAEEAGKEYEEFIERMIADGQKANDAIKKSIDDIKIAWMNIGTALVKAGGDIQQSFNSIVSGVASMFDPVTGAAIIMGATIFDQLFFGNKKKEKYIDENIKLISDFIESIRPKWGQLAIDIAKMMTDAFQFPTLTQSWADFVENLGKKFKSMIMENVAASILQMPMIASALREVSAWIAEIPFAATPKVMSDILAIVKNRIGLAMATIQPIFATLQNIITELDLDRMFRIEIPAPITGYWPDLPPPKLGVGGLITAPTLAIVGESGPEIVFPLDKLGAFGNHINIDIHDNYFKDRADIDYLTDKFEKKLFSKLNNSMRI